MTYSKAQSRYQTHKALQSGTITKQPCEVCGMEKVEAHHLDYQKPTNIMWLCRKHHREWHKKHGTTPNSEEDDVQIFLDPKTRTQLKVVAAAQQISMKELLRRYAESTYEKTHQPN